MGIFLSKVACVYPKSFERINDDLGRDDINVSVLLLAFKYSVIRTLWGPLSHLFFLISNPRVFKARGLLSKENPRPGPGAVNLVGVTAYNYIMPPIPPMPGMAGPWEWPSFSGASATKVSVRSTVPVMEAAFSKAVRTTLAGSTTPAFRRSQ